MTRKIKGKEKANHVDSQQHEEVQADSLAVDLGTCLETVERLEKEKDDFLDSLLRKQAEFENYRKRVNRERDDLKATAQADVVAELLPVIDSCEKALQTLPDAADDPRFSAYREGFELLLSSLQGVLSRFGVSEVPGEGSDFDPQVHEAVQSEPAREEEEGRVLEEFRKGYRMGNRLIRPSQVKVAVRAEEASKT